MKASVLFTLLFLTFITDNLFACSCIGQRSVQEEIKHADAILVGVIIDKQLITLTDSTTLNMFPNDTVMKNSPTGRMTIARYNLRVQYSYKGKITNDTVAIFTGLGGGDCGVSFGIGKKYIIYGRNETYMGLENNHFPFPKAENIFWTNSCSRTTSFHQDEITEIEKFEKKYKRTTKHDKQHN